MFNNDNTIKRLLVALGYTEIGTEKSMQKVNIKRFLFIVFLAIINGVIVNLIFEDLNFPTYMAGLFSMFIIYIASIIYRDYHINKLINNGLTGKAVSLIVYDKENIDKVDNKVTINNVNVVDTYKL